MKRPKIDKNTGKYLNMTLDQRISLKGFFEENKDSNEYWLVMKVFGFVAAVNYYLGGNINILKRLI